MFFAELSGCINGILKIYRRRLSCYIQKYLLVKIKKSVIENSQNVSFREFRQIESVGNFFIAAKTNFFTPQFKILRMRENHQFLTYYGQQIIFVFSLVSIFALLLSRRLVKILTILDIYQDIIHVSLQIMKFPKPGPVRNVMFTGFLIGMLLIYRLSCRTITYNHYLV